jgi:hypothetical protein
MSGCVSSIYDRVFGSFPPVAKKSAIFFAFPGIPVSMIEIWPVSEVNRYALDALRPGIIWMVELIFPEEP